MLRLNPFAITCPKSIEEVCAILRTHAEAMILAGGTDLIPKLKRGEYEPKMLVSLAHLPSLRIITWEPSLLSIGAMVPLHELERDERMGQEYPALAQALRQVATPTLRYSATIGGNLLQDTRCLNMEQSPFWREASGFCLKSGGAVCRVAPKGSRCFATFCSDLAPALAVLQAEVVLQGREKRTLSVENLYAEDGIAHLAKQTDELLLEIRIPRRARKSVYQKLRVRQGLDFPEVGLAVSWNEEDHPATLKVALTAIASNLLVFTRLGQPEEIKGDIDSWLDEISQVIKPTDNLSLPPGYRKRVAVKLLASAIQEVILGRGQQL